MSDNARTPLATGVIGRGNSLDTSTHAPASGTNRLIVFLTPGHEWRAGGVLSIAWTYRESVALRDLHGAEVALCVVPGDPPLSKYTWFANDDYLLNLESVLESRPRLDYLLMHVPEYAVNQVLRWLHSASSDLIRNIGQVHFNIMIQNIDLVEGQHIEEMKDFGGVTCTTAHEAYTNSASRQVLGIPLHRLSVCNGPELYSLSEYRDKDDLLVVSRDEHPLKKRVLQDLAQVFPQLSVQVVHDISYEDYRELIRRAKWSLTFGEGLDSYFSDVIWSGGVGFAVFNDRYFTPAFAKLENVYPSWEVLMDRISTDLQRLDEPVTYRRCWRQSYDLLGEMYSTERFRDNLARFYRGEYTFP